MENTMNENAVLRTLRAMINDEINKRIDVITEAQSNDFDIEDYRNDIETMISEYIQHNVTISIEA